MESIFGQKYKFLSSADKVTMLTIHLYETVRLRPLK